MKTIAKDKRLNADEVMCLQMHGMSTPDILRTDIDAFNRLLDEHEEFDDYLERANSILDRQVALGIETISCQDSDFPASLTAIGRDCPAVIHCLGNIDLLKGGKAVAVIDARSCDRQSFDAAYKAAQRYTRQGNVIVSGLALGCDTAAHRGCLDAKGDTIAVVGSGLDIVHPRESEPLQRAILDAGGLVLSEQPIGTKADGSRLVARNRLQAALSQVVILAQCPIHSGSLHTMRFARQYRKQSLAVEFPRPTDANAGNRDLLSRSLAAPLPL